MTFDDTDKKILKLLGENGRITNNDIARKLSISEGTVRNRIKKLESSGFMKVLGLINPDKVTDKQLVFLGVKVALSKDLAATAEKIAKLNNVKAVYISTGRYDIVVEAWLDVKFGLVNFLSGSLATISGVVSTESFLIMKSFKRWI
ncbi:MAG: Lrp/AsnC family transcriptional regulator [Candidatus Izemoplasmatales bacterium]|nr:Lrp/AsnC family transcriptional regulator [Candidatus Izemoplasmatales bacterium]